MVTEALRLGSVEEIVEAVRDESRLAIHGDGAHSAWRRPLDPAARPVRIALEGVAEFFPDDQVVVVRAGTSIRDLQSALGERGQCLPLVTGDDVGTVGGKLSMNLPHRLEAECGSWRDWVLGMTLVQADGTLAKVGSRAVKNVAGYDLQRVLIGSRGTLAVVTEVALRTFPVKSLPTPRVAEHGPLDGPIWLQRTLPTSFAAAVEAAQGLPGYDVPATNTLVRVLPPDRALPRHPHDWVLRAGCGERNLEITDPTMVRLVQRTKELLDPAGKLNRGELGVV